MKLNAEGTLENPFTGCRRCKAGNCEYLSVQSITAAESLRRKDRDEEAFFVLISFVLKFSGAANNGSFFTFGADRTAAYQRSLQGGKRIW